MHKISHKSVGKKTPLFQCSRNTQLIEYVVDNFVKSILHFLSTASAGSKYYENFLSFYYFIWSQWLIKNTTNEEDKVILTTWKQWFEVPTAILCQKRVFCVVAHCGCVISSRNFEETNRPRGFLSHFSYEAGTSLRNLRKQIHNHTT